VIHLNNGRTIWADHTRENGAHLEYDIGDNSYAILKSTVDHVEAGGVPPASVSPAAPANGQGRHDVPAFEPTGSLKDDGKSISELTDKVLPGGAVNADALEELEHQ
jgi:hypothetical protein